MLTASPALASSSPAPADAPARVLIAAQMAMLSRLAEIGMEIAEACGREAVSAAAPAAVDGACAPAEPRSFLPGAQSRQPPRDPGLAFARVARAVRMTIALQSRLLSDLAALDRGDAQVEQARKDARRIRLSRVVGQAVEATVEARRAEAASTARNGWAGGDEAMEDEIERLSYDAYERLIDAEDGDLAGLPFDAAVASVCADLGLSPDWAARLASAVTAPAHLHPGPQSAAQNLPRKTSDASPPGAVAPSPTTGWSPSPAPPASGAHGPPPDPLSAPITAPMTPSDRHPPRPPTTGDAAPSAASIGSR